jgi:hypothetical protein
MPSLANDGGRDRAVSREVNRTKIKPGGCLDKFLLVGAALVVCVVGGATFWLAEDYHVNPAWVFFAGNSILLVPLVGGEFRSQLKRPFFIMFFIAWMVMHGLTVLGLMRWVDVLYWIPLLAVELFIGYFAAYCLFDVPETETKDGQPQDKA